MSHSFQKLLAVVKSIGLNPTWKKTNHISFFWLFLFLFSFTPKAEAGLFSWLKNVLNLEINAAPLVGPGDAACVSTDEIGGIVFQDFNANGTKDAEEPFLYGASVSLYDDNGQVGVTLQTNGNGEYLFSSLTIGATYRVEFTIPLGMQEGPQGANSNSSIQKIIAGTCDASIGFLDPTDYCDVDPFVIIPCYAEMEYNGTYSGEAALAKLLYSEDGHHFDSTAMLPTFAASKMADHIDIGAVYGMAYQRTHTKMYMGTFHKRYVDYGPNGPDAIYQIDTSATITGVIEFDALLAATNTAGADPHDFTPVGGEVYDIGTSNASFDGPGKRAFGDLEISDDNQTLYVVNLFDRKIYAIDVSTGIVGDATIANSWDAPDATGASRHRPFALAWHRGKLWVGSVDENASNAYVHSLDPSGTTFNLELTLDLSYDRQAVVGTSPTEFSGNWNTWTTDPETTPFGIIYDEEIFYPQAMMTDIEFDGEDMILGFRDRFGDQSGGGKRFNIAATINTWGDAGGDILKVCYNNGSYVMETGLAGVCSGVGGIDNSGPGGYEFYHWDIYHNGNIWDPNTTNRALHWEITQGGLLQLDGKPSVMTTAMDPFNDFSGGVLKLDNSDGGREGIGTGSSSVANLTGGYTLYESGDYDFGAGGGPPVGNGTAAKGNGLGDLEAFCSPAPLEIGNLVWLDADSDGIQDPSETGIGSIVVTLTDENDVALGTVSTDANGHYNFTSADITGELEYFTDYKVKIGLADIQNNNPTLSGLALKNSGNGFNDNAAELIGDKAQVAITTGGPGDTEYAADFGFIETGMVGNRVWLDENSDGIQDAGEPGIPGIIIELVSTACTSGSNCPTTITDADGGYIFPRVGPGMYTVKVLSNVPAGLLPIYDEDDLTTSPDMETSVTVSSGDEYISADFAYNYVTKLTTDSPNVSDAGAIGNRLWNDANANGIQDPGESGIANITVTLMTDPDLDGVYATSVTTTTDAYGNYIFDNINPGAYVIKVSEADLTSAGFTISPTKEPDGDSNNTTEPIIIAPGDVWLGGDFGYSSSGTPGDIGSTVFVDVNGNGAYDSGSDIPLEGVTLALIADADMEKDWDAGEIVVATTVTAANGSYLFPDLPAGDYVVVVTDVNNIINKLSISADAEGITDGRSGLNLGAGNNLAQNFAYVPAGHDNTKGFIGDRIFLDADASANYSAGDRGLEGIEVQLLDGDDDSVLATTKTNESGQYFFGNLATDNYKVKVLTSSLPAGMTNSIDPDGSSPGMNITSSFALAAGASDLTNDFGYSANDAKTISGTFWKDSDADGELIADATETDRLEGVTLMLLDANGNIISTSTTQSNGTYSFTGIPAGVYTVAITDTDQKLANYWHSPTSGSDNEADGVSVDVSAASATGVDFGYFTAGAAIGNLVWMDKNENDEQDANEPGLPNAKITLEIDYNGGGADLWVSTLTDRDGHYSFKGLLLDEDYNGDGAGTEPSYNLVVSLPDTDMAAAYTTATANEASGNDKKDSDLHAGQTVAAVQGQANITNLADPDTETTAASYDFGFYPDCTDPVIDYAITTDGSTNPGIQTTDFFTEISNGDTLDVKKSQEFGYLQSWMYCQTGSWRYYYNPLDPDEYLFAIDMGANTTEIEYVGLRVDNDATDRHANATDDGTYVMGRDWFVKMVNDAALTAPVNIRFYFPPNEFKQMYDAAVAQATIWGVSTPPVSDVQWFMVDAFDPDADVNADGSALTGKSGYVDMTSTRVAATTALGSNTALALPAVENNINHIQFNGVTTITGGSAFIHINRIALPVELLEFSARPIGCEMLINWVSATEEKFDYYEVERSDDGRNFQALTRILGDGGLVKESYDFKDASPARENYYRLKMTNLDGSFEYSEIVFAQPDCIDEKGMFVFPNPLFLESDQTLTVRFFTETKSSDLLIADALGRKVKEIRLASSKNDWTTFQWDISGLAVGMYYVKDLASGTTRRFIIKK